MNLMLLPRLCFESHCRPYLNNRLFLGAEGLVNIPIGISIQKREWKQMKDYIHLSKIRETFLDDVIFFDVPLYPRYSFLEHGDGGPVVVKEHFYPSLVQEPCESAAMYSGEGAMARNDASAQLAC